MIHSLAHHARAPWKTRWRRRRRRRCHPPSRIWASYSFSSSSCSKTRRAIRPCASHPRLPITILEVCRPCPSSSSSAAIAFSPPLNRTQKQNHQRPRRFGDVDDFAPFFPTFSHVMRALVCRIDFYNCPRAPSRPDVSAPINTGIRQMNLSFQKNNKLAIRARVLVKPGQALGRLNDALFHLESCRVISSPLYKGSECSGSHRPSLYSVNEKHAMHATLGERD